MNTRLRAVLGRQLGVASTADALAAGTDHLGLRRSVARGELVRVRRGAYVDGRLWSVADPDERYRLSVMAVARTRPGDAVSHHAALALHGLPLWDHDRSRFDLVSEVRQVTSRNGLHLHPRSGVSSTQVDGVETASIERCLVRTALSMGRDCAVVAGDAALRSGEVTREGLLREVALVSPHQGRARALDAVLSMDSRAESAGESRTRLLLDDLGLSHDSQVVITDEGGEFVARVDFLVEGVVLEFDGRVKYQRTRDEGDDEVGDPGNVLWLEKRREDRCAGWAIPSSASSGTSSPVRAFSGHASGQPGRRPATPGPATHPVTGGSVAMQHGWVDRCRVCCCG